MVNMRDVNETKGKYPVQHATSGLRIAEVQLKPTYSNIDFLHGYCQIPLHKDSKANMHIQTIIGIFSLTRILQSETDSGTYFHDQSRKKFRARVHSMIKWVEYYLIPINTNIVY